MIRAGDGGGGDRNAKKPHFPSNTKTRVWNGTLCSWDYSLLTQAGTLKSVIQITAAGMSLVFTKGFQIRAHCILAAIAGLNRHVAEQLRHPLTSTCSTPVCLLCYGLLATKLEKNSNKIERNLLRDISLALLRCTWALLFSTDCVCLNSVELKSVSVFLDEKNSQFRHSFFNKYVSCQV